MKNYRLLLWATMLACSVTLEAKVTLPQLFQNGMVMQRNKAIPVWGKADAGEAVTVTLNKKKVETTADADGRWRVDLPKMKAGGPFQLTVNELTIDNVLIGDVWLLSGQSNIDVTIERVYPNYPDEIDHFSLDKVRLFRVQNETSTHGVKDDIRPTNINWKPLTKENA
jgi:sialate O-acetylesterase